MPNTTYTVNTTLGLLTKYVNERGLSTNYLTRNREVIEDGLWTWLVSRHLAAVHLEVLNEASEEVFERVEFSCTWRTCGEANDDRVSVGQNVACEDLQKQLLNQAKGLAPPPEGFGVRLVVDLQPFEEDRPPPDVDGWTLDQVGSRRWQASLDNHHTASHGDQ